MHNKLGKRIENLVNNNIKINVCITEGTTTNRKNFLSNSESFGHTLIIDISNIGTIESNYYYDFEKAIDIAELLCKNNELECEIHDLLTSRCDNFIENYCKETEEIHKYLIRYSENSQINLYVTREAALEAYNNRNLNNAIVEYLSSEFPKVLNQIREYNSIIDKNLLIIENNLEEYKSIDLRYNFSKMIEKIKLNIT